MAIFFKSLQCFLRAIEFLVAAVILAIYSYFLATLRDHDLPITTSIRAVEGISGAAVLYSLVGLLLLCCLSGLMFFSFIAIVLDLGFVGAFIYVAWENRHGANSCTGVVDTVFGVGEASSKGSAGTNGIIRLPTLSTACKLETATFSVAMVAIFTFLLSSVLELALARHHQRQKAFGPSPHNNYTSGTYPTGPNLKFPFFGRRQRNAQLAEPSPDALPSFATPADFTPIREEVRTSYSHTEGDQSTLGGHGGYDGNASSVSGGGFGSGYKNPSITYGYGGGAAGGGYGRGGGQADGVASSSKGLASPKLTPYDRYGNNASSAHRLSEIGRTDQRPVIDVPPSHGFARNY